jgi:hypothetical protein
MQEMGKAQWETLSDFITHPGAPTVFPGGVHVRYIPGEVILSMKYTKSTKKIKNMNES